MSARRTGWLFVGIQIVLLVTVVVLPPRDDWPTPAWLLTLCSLATLGGLAIVVLSSVSLGSSLTATPEPRANGGLRRTGPYGIVRHPIYSGVLLIVIGVATRSGSLATLVVAAVTVGFFRIKSGWEEQRLRARFAEYDAYVAETSRFFPLPARRRR